MEMPDLILDMNKVFTEGTPDDSELKFYGENHLITTSNAACHTVGPMPASARRLAMPALQAKCKG